ncbi:hypothetical protein HCU93_004428 [Salmonella enterica]|nr:hypothetical protein [Salmonella enterica subsp. enterica serovar Kentucky]
MTFEQKKARAIALMDSKKMWRSNYAPPLLCILWRLGIRLPPLPFMPFWQVAVLTGGLWGTSWGCAMWFIYWGPSGMVAGEAIIISITGGFLFGLLTASFHWWRRKVNRLPPWDDV